MSALIKSEQSSSPPRVTLVEGQVVGWFAVAFLHTILGLVLTSEAQGSLSSGQRALFVVYDLAQPLCLGVAITLTASALRATGQRHALLPWGLALAASAGAGIMLLQDDLAGVAGRLLSEGDSRSAVLALAAGVALLVPLVAWLSGLLARGWLRALPLVAALALTFGNLLLLRGDYPAIHLLLGVCAAVAAASLLPGTPGLSALSPRVKRAVGAVLCCFAVFAAVWPPSNAVRAELARASWSYPLSRLLPRALWSGDKGATHNTSPNGVFEPGTRGGPTPPSVKPLLGDDLVVIYLSVDSLRADLLEDRYAKKLPNMHALRKRATWFKQARAPGSTTAVTLTSVMTGKYYSQLYWTMALVPEGKGVRALFAHEDDSVRFPELLSKAGVATVHYGQAQWLHGKFGMVRGFSEEHVIAPVPGKPSTKGKWSTGADIMAELRQRLSRHGQGRLFAFFHDLDPHSPFDLGQNKGSAKERYLSEVQLVDGRLGELEETLRASGLAARTVIILTADHGEGFGEHGTSFHGQNLYDEQVRVPLLIFVPGREPQEIDTAVSLMDLGPTILDLMRLETPAHFMGQSLVPYLWGERPQLTRPIIAEGRLKQSLLLPSGRKLIRDQPQGTFEIYDLNADPREQKNLYDDLGEEGQEQMKTLAAFFERYELRREGYITPMRR